MRRILSLVLVGLTFLGMTACSPAQKSGEEVKTEQSQVVDESSQSTLKYISGKDLTALLADEKAFENMILVDVRTPEEYSAGHIKGAINIPLQSFDGDLSKIEDYKEKTIILYCRSGNRSGQAGEFLVKNGFKDVYNADGVSKFSYDLVTE